MNLLQLAKNAMENKKQWASGESVSIFTNAKNTVYLKRSQHGKVVMFIVENGKINTGLSKKNLSLGFVGKFNCSAFGYERWVNAVKGAL